MSAQKDITIKARRNGKKNHKRNGSISLKSFNLPLQTYFADTIVIITRNLPTSIACDDGLEA